jgi:flavin-dependent dehydrogenase
MPVGRVVIVGAGPARAALADLLARRGVEVALLERHPDFERTFLGSDRLGPRLEMRLLPLLVKSRLLHLLLGKPLRAFHQGVVPVRLTA